MSINKSGMSRPSNFMRSVVKPRFKAWLASALEEGSISEGSLSTAILKLRNPDGVRGLSDSRPRVVSAWKKGTSVPTARLVFEAGEALRYLGLTWSSGPVALYSAGYLSDFYGVIAGTAVINQALAARLALASPFAAPNHRWTIEEARTAASLAEDEALNIRGVFAVWLAKGIRQRDLRGSASLHLSRAIEVAKRDDLPFHLREMTARNDVNLWIIGQHIEIDTALQRVRSLAIPRYLILRDDLNESISDRLAQSVAEFDDYVTQKRSEVVAACRSKALSE